jgi:hypothetical protein
MISFLLPSAKGLSFTLLLSQFTYSFLSLKQTLVSTLCATILICLLIALIILLCVDNYPWDIHVTSWKQLLKLYHPLCCFNVFYFESIALWVTSYAKLFDACLESTIHEKFLLIWFSCLLFIYLLANYRPLPWVTSFMTWALQYYLIKIVWKHVSSEIILLLSFYLLEDE